MIMWKLSVTSLSVASSAKAFVIPSSLTSSPHASVCGKVNGAKVICSKWNKSSSKEASSNAKVASLPTKPRSTRNGLVCLDGPLNVMSLERGNVPMVKNLLVNGMDSIDLLDLVDVSTYTAQDFFPRELSTVEEESIVIDSPENTKTLRDHPSTAFTSSTQSALQPMEEGARKSQLDHPTIANIIKFTLPAIGVWLCSPVLSMIDTASVGLLAGTAQQAALNPAVSVTDYGALLVAFMYTATTNLIAGAQENDNSPEWESSQRTTKTLVTALRLALLVGVFFGAVLGSSSNILLKLLIGNDSIDPAVFGAALRYVQIRCLGMPAAVVIGTAQSACLGMQDVKTPLYVLAAAAGINLVGDLLLVRNQNVWLGGAAGAAWATVLSQYGALFMFLKWLTSKGAIDDHFEGHDNSLQSSELSTTSIRDNLKNVIKVTRGNKIPSGKGIRKTLLSSSDKKKGENTKDKAPAKGFLSGKYKALEILNVASLDKSTARKFLPFVIPVTTTSIGRVSGYVAMSHVASSALGTLDMAAHQIAISIFCCLAPVVDALNQVAQSFVPGIFARKKSKERALALRRTSINFAKVGAAFGAVIVGLVTLGVPVLSRFFTTDPYVLERVKNAIPGIAVFLGFDGLMCIGEGTLLGQKDLSFLRNMYASFFFIVPAFMLRLKRRALSGIPVGIGTMWGTFSVYEVVRTVLWLLRVIQLQWKTEKEVAELDGGSRSKRH